MQPLESLPHKKWQIWPSSRGLCSDEHNRCLRRPCELNPCCGGWQEMALAIGRREEATHHFRHIPRYKCTSNRPNSFGTLRESCNGHCTPSFILGHAVHEQRHVNTLQIDRAGCMSQTAKMEQHNPISRVLTHAAKTLKHHTYLHPCCSC
jgi:hypothetical protein